MQIPRLVYCLDFNRDKIILLIALIGDGVWDACHVPNIREYTLATGQVLQDTTTLGYPDVQTMQLEYLRLKADYNLYAIRIADIPLLVVEGY